jgi:hypothetical protein
MYRLRDLRGFMPGRFPDRKRWKIRGDQPREFRMRQERS